MRVIRLANLQTGFCLLLGVLLLPILMSACTTTGVVTKSESSVYDRVMKSGKLRCGYALYKPGCMKDPNTGKLSGIGIEALELVAKNLGLEIEFGEEVGWGTMLEGLQTGRYDIIATPVWTQGNRARVADFSKPLYFSPVFAYVKAGNKKLIGKDVSILNSKEFSIGTIDGATAEKIAQEEFPNARRVSLTQLSDFSQLLMNVSTGKADATFTELADATGFLKNNPNSIEQMNPGKPVRIFPSCWLIKRGQFELKEMIDTALEQLQNSGVIDRLIKKYEPAEGTVYRVKAPYQTN